MVHPAWISQAVREAAAAGQVGEVIRLVRRAHGLNQRQLGVATGRSQSTISRIERGGSGTRDVETLRRLGNELAIPLVMLGLAGQPSQNQHSEPPVNRRELILRAAATVFASAALPGTILAADESAANVHAITVAHRKLDGITPSSELAEPVLAHLRMATRIQTEVWDPIGARAMAAAVSEVAGLAGWLHWDMHNLGSARRHYRLALKHAQRADDSLLTTYMLGSLAFFVVHEGEADEGLALIRHAVIAASPGQRPAIADAWLAAMEAVAHATAGDDTQTWRALDRAAAAAERITTEERPPWPWVFPFGTQKIAYHQLSCAVRLRRPDIAYAAVDALSFSDPGHRKQHALVLLDLASAHVQNHELDEALRVATAAIDLAEQTQSERVLSRARQFRRMVPATAPQGVLRDFDECLRAANARDRTLE
jgi:transcriptional regulator with XRE-family HTH domain